MKRYYGVDPKEKRESLLKSDSAKIFIDEIISSADEAIGMESIAFKMSDFLLFHQTGDRHRYEKGYFKRRERCNYIMMAYWLTRDEKYLMPLIDYINYICDEFTWCLPAHTAYPAVSAKDAMEHVDLFQAETARLFGEIIMCVGDFLPEHVKARMKYEVERRIFASLDNGKVYEWETCRMNWATVCGAGCTVAAMYFGDERKKEAYAKRFEGCLISYLEGILDDGCCQEGLGYWNYGFSHFMILAQVIKVHTEGQVDYFKLPKVREIALFLQKTRMSDSYVASFSDGGERLKFKVGMVSFLKSMYPEVRLPNLKCGGIKGNVDSVSEMLWFDDAYVAEPNGSGTYYFPNSQWYVKNTPAYSFAAKGGHNNEPHNHNDIGSFMITVGEEIFISDLGCGEYVKATFRPETRYTFVQNSSRGHSVPIINGTYQSPGKEFCAHAVSGDEEHFALDLAPAYGGDEVTHIDRKFTFDENTVHLQDEFVFAAEACRVCERFVSKIAPGVETAGIVEFGCGAIVYDETKYRVEVSTETFVAHNAVDIVTVYLVDFTCREGEMGTFACEFRVHNC